MRVACVVPTYNGRVDFLRLKDSLKLQNYKFDLIVVDSNSNDGTGEIATNFADYFIQIDKKDFNHGGTRQLIIDTFPNYDVYVYLTQDVILANEQSIDNIIEPFADEKVDAVYGRQLPHDNATIFSAHAREFSYPKDSIMKSKKDIPILGLKAAFLSNSFAAYRAQSLNSIGGFPKNAIFAEDMFVAAKIILNGGYIFYASNALCKHSHNYTLIEEFQRYFDMGVFHAREAWIAKSFGNAGGEGIKYLRSEIKYIGLKKFYLWPISILKNGIKYIGYKLGNNENIIPRGIKRKIGMSKIFWQ